MMKPEPKEPLAAFRGKQRLLLVFAPDRQHPLVERQDELLRGTESMFGRYKLLRLTLTASDVRRSPFGIPRNTFWIALLDSDGRTVLERPEPIYPRDLSGKLEALQREADRRAFVQRQTARR